MKDIAKRGLVGLLTVSMCLSNVQGIAFADNRVEVGGVKVDGKKVTLNLNGGSLMVNTLYFLYPVKSHKYSL